MNAANLKLMRSDGLGAANPESDIASGSALTHRRGVWVGRVFGGAITAFGAVLAGGGLWLSVLGGSLYYLVTGIGYVSAGVLLWRRRPAGGWLALSLLLATVVWALWEVGLDYWALFPRVLLPAGLTFLALLATQYFPANKSRRAAISVAGALALLMVGKFALAFLPHGAIYGPGLRTFVAAEKSAAPSNWYSYGRTSAGTRYAPFTEIDRENVAQLEPAWIFRSGDIGPGIDQSTPLQIGELLYTCVRNNRITALDVDTGQVRWRYDPGAPNVTWAHCRGVGYYELPAAQHAGAVDMRCARRIFTSTVDSRLIALDASSGEPCPDFGGAAKARCAFGAPQQSGPARSLYKVAEAL